MFRYRFNRKSGLRFAQTGRAVCAEAGEPYKSRLFRFPQYIVDKNYNPELSEVADLLRMTEFFLNKNFFKLIT